MSYFDVSQELGELFSESSEYRKSENYKRFLAMCASFKQYSIFNLALIYTQMPGAFFCRSQRDWWREYRRIIKADERPLIALQTFGPVMLLYDVSQTMSVNPYNMPLPMQELEMRMEPFRNDEPGQSLDPEKFNKLLENLPYCGILFSRMRAGSAIGGKLEHWRVGEQPLITLQWKDDKNNEYEMEWIPAYTIKCNDSLSQDEIFPILVHELGHFFLRHLPCNFPSSWGESRDGLSLNSEEFEAESVAWLVCRKLGLQNIGSQKYLAGYLEDNDTIPFVDVMAIANAVDKILGLFKDIKLREGMLFKLTPELAYTVDIMEWKTKPAPQRELAFK